MVEQWFIVLLTMCLARCTPLGVWGGLAYGCLPCFARVFYWYHWVGDVLAGATVAFLASQIVIHFNGGVETMDGCTWRVFLQQILPCFGVYMVMLKVMAKVLRPPPNKPGAMQD